MAFLLRSRIGTRFGAPVAFVVGLMLAPTAAAQTTAPGWTVRDIGQPPAGGHASFGPDLLTLTSSGAEVAGIADQFTFAYRPIAGNATIVAKVDALQALDAGAQAGVMIRGALDAGAPHAFMLASGNGGTAFRSRGNTDGSTSDTKARAVSIGGEPIWLKLERTTSDVVASRSVDGVNWTAVATARITFAETVYVGLAVASHAAPSWISAGFSRVRVVGNGTLDDGFSAIDIGQPVLSGGSWSDGETFLVDGSGRSVGADPDQLRFVYRAFTGDADVMTRVAAFEAATPDTHAGLVVRESLDATSPYAAVFATPQGVEFASRSVAGERPSVVTGGAASDAVYLRLRRRDNVVTALRSPDGIYWMTVAQQAMSSDLGFVGIGVTSNDTTQTARVRFDHTVIAAASPSTPREAASTRSHDESSVPLAAVETPVPVGAVVPPTLLIFTASTLHDDVERYVLEVFLEGANTTTARALSTTNLGRPVRVNGECTVDVRARIAALAPGRYIATVTAVVPAQGIFQSDPSAVFTR
jgi:regulation of enolase protein 1 (concanavalin A-like superfamily)